MKKIIKARKRVQSFKVQMPGCEMSENFETGSVELKKNSKLKKKIFEVQNG